MLKKQVLLQTLLILCIFTVQADVYLHSVRGSNNRLDEANRERNNGNRMFDSENNDRGGYNVGKLNYYETEDIPISFTLQHGCGTDDVKHCEVIIQAMCDPMMRDGTTTQRIPDNPANCRNFNCDTDVKYGRHESYAFYQTCKQTERNKGLFQASQNPNGNDATKTRQNPGGNRQGYECPEERDYYPYWGPSPWKDIAMFTKDMAKCQALKAESANVKPRHYCNVPQVVKDANNFGNGIGKTPNNYEACMALDEATNDAGNVTKAEWVTVPANGWPEPLCLQSEASRPNHLGLIGNKKQWTFNWKVPQGLVTEGEEMGCAIRLRYNITEDFDASRPDPTTGEFNTLDPGEVTAAQSRKTGGGGNAGNRPATLDVWSRYGLTDDDVGYNAATNVIANANNNNLGDSRDYVMRNNPRVDVMGQEFGNNNFRLRLQLAINTAQYGRTFQDRTHTFYIKKRPADIPTDAALKLITVSGKRGNIVQTFPGHEYFFVPEITHVSKNDYVHFGWSGSDTNPNNNDGQGKQGTDRSNIVVLQSSHYDADPTAALQGGTMNPAEHGSLGNNYPAYVTDPTSKGYGLAAAMSACGSPEEVSTPMAGFDQETLASLATLRRQKGAKKDYGNMEELDDAGTSFQMEPVKATAVGCWNYVSTRNNNFSNRSQKGTLCVDEGDYAENDVGPSGNAVVGQTGWIMIPEGSLMTMTTFKFMTQEDDDSVSDLTWIEPVEMNLAEGKKVQVAIQYSQRTLSTAVMQHRKSDDEEWKDMDNAEYNEADDGETVASAWVDEGGWYRVDDKPNVGAIVAIVFSALVFMGVVGFMVWYQFYRNPNKSDEYSVNNAI